MNIILYLKFRCGVKVNFNTPPKNKNFSDVNSPLRFFHNGLSYGKLLLCALLACLLRLPTELLN